MGVRFLHAHHRQSKIVGKLNYCACSCLRWQRFYWPVPFLGLREPDLPTSQSKFCGSSGAFFLTAVQVRCSRPRQAKFDKWSLYTRLDSLYWLSLSGKSSKTLETICQWCRSPSVQLMSRSTVVYPVKCGLLHLHVTADRQHTEMLVLAIPKAQFFASLPTLSLAPSQPAHDMLLYSIRRPTTA